MQFQSVIFAKQFIAISAMKKRQIVKNAKEILK
jgi:hypothetical protein